ncbi:MAG: hypothetical protein CVU77_03040 [Elusimicrobia bacterium HGW-Elusimicrobia-1]|jgi:hypothetical protein|nr:MAG: hypothetical protein CVU77_03040 [Elusimicrobia bacterium HGW-Elusimicrobia-1]
MAKILFINSLVFLFCVNSVFAQQIVLDLTAVADRNIQAALYKVHKVFTENKWVENIRILNQNYSESKRFYDTMTELSKHKGGLLGYYQDRAIDRFDRAGKSAYWRLRMPDGNEKTGF